MHHTTTFQYGSIVLLYGKVRLGSNMLILVTPDYFEGPTLYSALLLTTDSEFNFQANANISSKSEYKVGLSWLSPCKD